MEAKKIFPEKVVMPDCEAGLSVETVRYWHGRGRPGNEEGKNTCGYRAKYEIEGRFFCRKHAGLFLLDSMIVDDEVKNCKNCSHNIVYPSVEPCSSCTIYGDEGKRFINWEGAFKMNVSY